MYLYDIVLEKLWAIDIEGDPIPSTKVWLLCAINAKTKERVALRDYDEIRTWVNEQLKGDCKFIAHNGIGYDFPTLNRIIGCNINMKHSIDTLVMSMVYDPSMLLPRESQILPKKERKGPHSLQAWGFRVRLPKIEYDDFESGYTPEMEEYCFRDVEICLEVYLRLSERMRQKEFSDISLDIEHRAWQIIQTQKKNGFAFNKQEAEILYAKLRRVEKEIEEEAYKFWPPSFEIVRVGKGAYKKDGEPSKNLQTAYERYEKVQVRDDNDFECWDYVYFEIGSPQQRVEKLLELGWEPREFTEGGNPQPTHKGKLNPSLLEFVEESGNSQVQLIASWMEANSRANMINTWIEAYNEETGCIHGSLFLANTHRYKHSGPNTANIPGVRLDKEDHPLYGKEGAWTYESRDLWTTRDRSRRRLVGVDAKGIQLRVLAHYLNNPEFTASILSSDPHTANQQAFNLPSRAITKTITYAIIMGAGDGRIASEAKVSLKEAKAHKALFFEKIPELKTLIDKLKEEANDTGRITLCDGSKVIIHSDHTVIPFLLQGDESKIMKKAMFTIALECVRRGIDAIQCGMIHDELQYDVLAEHVEEFKEICLDAFLRAGEFFNYNLPTEGDAKVGYTWSETH